MTDLSGFDRRGRVVVYAVAMQMVGLAVGPGLALVTGDAEFHNVNRLGIALFLVSLALILLPVAAQSRRYRLLAEAG